MWQNASAAMSGANGTASAAARRVLTSRSRFSYGGVAHGAGKWTACSSTAPGKVKFNRIADSRLTLTSRTSAAYESIRSPPSVSPPQNFLRRERERRLAARKSQCREGSERRRREPKQSITLKTTCESALIKLFIERRVEMI
ncbi:unnamed protein product [Euphydryas editha]|uniref:Uncharacterized protein n=1 Tax=Euphydryas editha TaxID=104508 RepID=A0AAU9TKQ6_EUPED|nr:unnamed protein product [Euphydryas editha]